MTLNEYVLPETSEESRQWAMDLFGIDVLPDTQGESRNLYAGVFGIESPQGESSQTAIDLSEIHVPQVLPTQAIPRSIFATPIIDKMKEHPEIKKIRTRRKYAEVNMRRTVETLRMRKTIEMTRNNTDPKHLKKWEIIHELKMVNYITEIIEKETRRLLLKDSTSH